MIIDSSELVQAAVPKPILLSKPVSPLFANSAFTEQIRVDFDPSLEKAQIPEGGDPNIPLLTTYAIYIFYGCLVKACGKPLYRVLAALIISSFEAAYFPCCFKTAKVIVLPKPNKTTAQKFTPGAWRPISLLNSLGKVVEAAFARRVTDAAEAEHLLPDGQMDNRRNRSTDLAIRMVVEAAIEARKRGGVASLLQLDIKEAFDAIHHR
jgi:hypothetical protein